MSHSLFVVHIFDLNETFLLPCLIFQANCIHAKDCKSQITWLSRNSIRAPLPRCQREGLAFDYNSLGSQAQRIHPSRSTHVIQVVYISFKLLHPSCSKKIYVVEVVRIR